MKSKLVLACFFMMNFGAFAQGNGPVNSGVEREYCAIEYSRFEPGEVFGLGRWDSQRIELIQTSFVNEITLVKDSEGNLLGLFLLRMKDSEGGVSYTYKERSEFLQSLNVPYTLESVEVGYYLRHIYGQKFLALDVKDTKMDVPIGDESFKIVTQIAKTARIVCQNK